MVRLRLIGISLSTGESSITTEIVEGDPIVAPQWVRDLLQGQSADKSDAED